MANATGAGRIYAVQCIAPDGPYTKIGATENPIEVRVSVMRSSTPFPLEVVREYAPMFLVLHRERQMKKILSPFLIHGEWFKADVSAVDHAFEVSAEAHADAVRIWQSGLRARGVEAALVSKGYKVTVHRNEVAA